MNRPQELLISLLRAAPVPIASEEWPAVVKEANRHGLAPYLYHALQLRANLCVISPAPAHPHLPALAPLPVPPDSVLESLRRAYLQNASVNFQRFHYLGLALRALSAAGVPVIVLKGGYLAEAVYGNIALRTMCDIDILVKREDIAAADAALRRIDFESWEKRVEALADTNEFHYNHRKAGRILLELHHELVDSDYPFYMESGALWDSAVPVRIAEADAFTLSPEDLLVYQGIHAALHSFSMGLRLLVDTMIILDRLPVNWNTLIDRARRNRASKPVWILLALSRSLFDLPIPGPVLSSLRPHDPAAADAHLESARAAIFKSDGAELSGAEGNPKVLLFFGRRGLPAKISLVFHKAFPSWRKVAGIYNLNPKSPLVLFHYPHCLWTRLQRFAPAIKAETAARLRMGPKGPSADPRKNVASLMDWLMRAE